jgi:hypothetical protein
MPISFDSKGMISLPMLTELTYLFGIPQVPLGSAATTITMATIVGTSLSSPRGTKSPPKNAHFGALLRVSFQYVCGAADSSRDFCSSYLRS